MELTDYIRILRKRWIIIVATVVAAIALAGAFTAITTPQYKATTELFVSATTGTNNASDLSAGNTFTSQRVKSYATAVSTASVLQPVIRSLRLSDTVGELAGRVSAEAPLNTVILNVSVTDPDPTQAAAIANAIGATLPRVVDEIENTDSTGTSPVKISTLQPAEVPEAADSPNGKLNLALGLLLGLALGIGGAVLLEVLDTKIRTVRDVNSITPRPVIGGVPQSAAENNRDLVVLTEPRSGNAEAFRSMRTNIQFVLLDHGNSVTFTSSVAAEGKTTTIANLAVAFAEAGGRVIVVDADLRRPRICEVFDIEGAVGLTDVLIGNADLEDIVQPWGDSSLHVLPAGRIPPNPSELLGGESMRDLIKQLENDYDLVLFDCAPVLPVTDAAVLATLTSGTVLVTAAGSTQKNQLAAALKALDAVKATVLGVVLTKLPTKGVDAYSYTQYGYYGEYSRVHEDTDESASK